MLPPPPTVLWKRVAVPTRTRGGALPSPEDGAAAEPRGSSRFPSLSVVYVRLAPRVFFDFMLRVVIQYDCSVAELALALALRSSSVGSSVHPPPDTPICGGCCVFLLSTSLPRAQDAPGSSRHFLLLRVSVPPGSPVPSAGNGVRHHDLGADVWPRLGSPGPSLQAGVPKTTLGLCDSHRGLSQSRFIMAEGYRLE